jgi:hypothetical protein
MYGKLLYDSNKVSLDDSPLYWRRMEMAREFAMFMPDTRVILLLRHPVERALSAYKYFCKPYMCDSTTFRFHVRNTIRACQRVVCVAERFRLLECIERNASMIEGDVWPFSDVDLLKKYYTRCADQWDLMGEPTMSFLGSRAVIYESLYWIGLEQWLGAFPHNHFMMVSFRFFRFSFPQDHGRRLQR